MSGAPRRRLPAFEAHIAAERRPRPHSPRTTAQRRRTTSERRRRERHFRRRRRDLLEDAVLGFVLAIVLIGVTAGLGVLALVVVPAGLALIVWVVVVRVRRWRGVRSGPGLRSPGSARSRRDPRSARR